MTEMRKGFYLALAAWSLVRPLAAQTTVDNAALIPKIVPDGAVQMEGMSPDWVKTLVLAEVRIETATPEGTFAAATKVLDHYAKMGVNGLWIDPIWDRWGWGNGYGNTGIGFVAPQLTGAANNEASIQVVKRFVDEAHKRNIRVFFDTVVWGTLQVSPLVKEHPDFYQKKDGQFVPSWGGWGFDWDSAPLKAWYKDTAVRFIDETGADGYRVDLAPAISGYFFKEIRDALKEQGHKIAIISELLGERRDTFDFEETSVTGWTEEADFATPGKFDEQKKRFGKHNDFIFHSNLVDDIQTGVGIGSATLQQQGRGGEFRFYTSTLLNHDDEVPFVKGDRVRFAYSVLAPFLPMWWIGEEWNNPLVWRTDRGGAGVMYFNTIDWSKLDAPENRAFYEDCKRVIRVRRQFPDIFEDFPENARQANIVKLAVTRDGAPIGLQAYARFANGRAVLVVPNDSETGGTFQVTVDPQALGLKGGKVYQIVDLMTEKPLAIRQSATSDPNTFSTTIDGRHVGVYAMEIRP